MKKSSTALLIVAFLLIAVAFLFLPVRDWFEEIRLFVASFGAVAPLVFAVLYAALTVMLVPGSVLTIGAGAIFGLWTGLAVVIAGANLGALGSFALARTAMRERVTRWAVSNPKFASVDRAIGVEGFKVVLLLRLSPIFPFTLSNYLLGLTSVRAGSYVLANLIGMLPGTVLFVSIGAATGSAIGSGADANLGLARQALLVGGVLATAVMVTLVTRAARKALAGSTEGTAEVSAESDSSSTEPGA